MQLSRDDVKHGMGAIQAKAVACFQKFHAPGTATVSMVIGGSGKVTSAETKGGFAGTPTGDCVAKAAHAASFPKFRGQPMSVAYPFMLR